MKRLLEVKLKVFKEEYPKHLELFKKETGITLDVNDVHTFAKFDRWKKRRIKDAIKASCDAEIMIMELSKIYYKDALNFDNGLCLDPVNHNIYFPSDGSDAAGELFHVDPFKTRMGMTRFLETDPMACEMVRNAMVKVEEIVEEHEYNEFVRKHSE